MHCTTYSNTELIKRLKSLTGDERKIQAQFLAHLAEVDRRRIYAEMGYSSLFRYCVKELGLAEGSTSRRIATARAARQFPQIYQLIADGRIHMTAVALISPLLTEKNVQRILCEACGKSKREIEQLIVRFAPKPDVKDMIRQLPVTRHFTITGDRDSATDSAKATGQELLDCSGPATEEKTTGSLTSSLLPPTPARRDEIKPLSEERVKIQFSGSVELRKLLERAKEVLRHTYPEGKLEDVFEAALQALLEKKDPYRKLMRKQRRVEKVKMCHSETGCHPEGVKRLKDLSRDHLSSCREILRYAQNDTAKRRIPQSIKDHVFKRDEGRCQFVGSNSERCCEQGCLEFDHIQPWALGGRSDDPANVRLLCRTHNQMYARKTFGRNISNYINNVPRAPDAHKLTLNNNLSSPIRTTYGRIAEM